MTSNPCPASRHRPAPRLVRPSWPETFDSGHSATRRGRLFNQQNPLDRNSNLTPRITRPPQPFAEYEITRVAGRVHAVVRLRDIFSPCHAARRARGHIQPAPCLTPPACPEVRPRIMAGNASTSRLRHPARPRFPSAEFLYRNSNLTPGITRRPERLPKMRSSVSAVGCMPLLDFGFRFNPAGESTHYRVEP